MVYYTAACVQSMKLDVVLTPNCVEEDDLRGCLCTVVDVLRATSTIIAALCGGALAVRPCLDIAEARRGAAAQGPGYGILGGEEKGHRIRGFDLGNSPLEYLVPDIVTGKVIFFYTTNGTGAIRRAYAGSGQPVYIAALLNLSAASLAMTKAASASGAAGIAILCSGRYGRPSAEDFFCAGLMVYEVGARLREAGIVPEFTDAASIAAEFAAANKERSLDVLASSEHGRYLQSLGFAADLEFAAQLDLYDLTPIFDGERVVLLQSDR